MDLAMVEGKAMIIFVIKIKLLWVFVFSSDEDHLTIVEDGRGPIPGMSPTCSGCVMIVAHFLSFAVLDLVHTVQSETGRVEVEGHAVDPGLVPTLDPLHVRSVGPIPDPNLAQFPLVDPIPDLLSTPLTDSYK